MMQCRLGTFRAAARPEGPHVLSHVGVAGERSTISWLRERVADAAAAHWVALHDVTIMVTLASFDGSFLWGLTAFGVGCSKCLRRALLEPSRTPSDPSACVLQELRWLVQLGQLAFVGGSGYCSGMRSSTEPGQK